MAHSVHMALPSQLPSPLPVAGQGTPSTFRVLILSYDSPLTRSDLPDPRHLRGQPTKPLLSDILWMPGCAGRPNSRIRPPAGHKLSSQSFSIWSLSVVKIGPTVYATSDVDVRKCKRAGFCFVLGGFRSAAHTEFQGSSASS